MLPRLFVTGFMKKGGKNKSKEKAKIMAEFLKRKLRENGHEICINFCW